MSIIFISCTLLIFINYFTIKILSANRAYVNGESHYSKAQKDAARYLITYIWNKNPAQWESFKTELSVPQAIGTARLHLIMNSDIDTIKTILRKTRTDEADFDDMIWLYYNFKDVSFLRKAIIEWEKGDALINRFNILGDTIHTQIQMGNLNKDSKRYYLSQINSISDNLTVNSRNFSAALGEGTREIKKLLIYINIFFILIIICSVTLYYAAMIKRLLNSKHLIEAKNADLTLVNKELDRFVYCTSHDLRAPICSLKGLVDLMKTEEDPEEVKNYLDIMETVLNKQDQFIKDIIDYSRNKRTKDILTDISLYKIIDDAIEQLRCIENINRITFEKQLQVDQTYSDNLRLRIIINNLISNAVKYADFNKEQPFISIKTHRSQNNLIIQIEDNGIGISQKNLSHIFEMFFATNKNKGTGLGLYIVMETIENLHGNIEVESTIDIGTKFIVTIPLQNKT
ncbi:MAG: HAMP domain-containing sensor histidine kinase [Flavobacterium sp.]